jgi:DNA-binding Xre family transcriptional regulator
MNYPSYDQTISQKSVLSIQQMLSVNLRSAMEQYRETTGERLTYQILAKRTGISVNTLQSLASRADYNTTLATIEKLCIALRCNPGELLELRPSDADQAR